MSHTATLTDLRGRQRHAILATFRYTGARAGEVSDLFVNTHPFVPDPHKRCSVSALEREVRLAAEGAGLPGRHYPHRWRHSLATELIRAGVGVAQVQRQLGHASIASTMIYTHLDVDDVRASMDQVFGGGD